MGCISDYLNILYRICIFFETQAVLSVYFTCTGRLYINSQYLYWYYLTELSSPFRQACIIPSAEQSGSVGLFWKYVDLILNDLQPKLYEKIYESQLKQ